MAGSEYHLDTRIRRRHVPLVSQQRRLRHLRSVSARNILIQDKDVNKEFSLEFTLHKRPHTLAFYRSEIIQDDLNPSWKDFESSNFPDITDTALPYVIVKVWDVSEKQLLVEWMVFFSGLVFLGEQIPKEGKNFKPNTLIFGMSEGFYGCRDCYQHSGNNSSDATVRETIDVEMTGLRTSYTLSTLSRIKTVERAIKQTQANVQRRRNSINARLQSCQEIHHIHAQQEMLKIRISVLKTELQYQLKNSHALKKELDSQNDYLTKKRNEINNKIEDQKILLEKCYELSKFHSKNRETCLKTEAQLNMRRKQMVSELSYIYPIAEFPDQKGFSIHNAHLPNSEDFAGHDEVMIAVALGYVSHLVAMISQFLNLPLRYHLNFYGSRSSIVDHVTSALPDKSREFPLHLKGKDKKCFEYGVFLLNKNIGQLRIYCRMNTRDLSATLPNLNSLIELRLSSNSDPPPNLPLNPCDSQSSFSTVQNGVSDYLRQSNSGPANALEVEVLRREMEAMIPNSTLQNPLLPPIVKDSVLSSSLDKGLNEIKIFEQTAISEMERKPTRNSTIAQLMKDSHHSSFPNLNSALPPGGRFENQILPMPLKEWKVENSHTNSEEETVEDISKLKKQTSVVLTDSIFYIPSVQDEEISGVNGHSNETVDCMAVSDDFSADLSLRTEQLANRSSSFQMQRLHLANEEDSPNL